MSGDKQNESQPRLRQEGESGTYTHFDSENIFSAASRPFTSSLSSFFSDDPQASFSRGRKNLRIAQKRCAHHRSTAPGNEGWILNLPRFAFQMEGAEGFLDDADLRENYKDRTFFRRNQRAVHSKERTTTAIYK